MHPVEAAWTAEHLERLLATSDERVRATCHAIPLRPGGHRRGCRWCFVVWTDADERTVREALMGCTVEHHGRRGKMALYVAWPAR